MISPNFRLGKYTLLFSDKERLKFENYLRESGQNEIHLQIRNFYNSKGEIIETIENISKIQFPKFPMDATEVDGVFNTSSFIKINERLFAINGIKYHIPIQHTKELFTIESSGNATILVKSETLGINKLITDIDMKNAINMVLKKS